VRFVGALVATAFLSEETIAGPRLGQFLAQNLLGSMIGSADEIARPLEGDLKMLDLTEIAGEAACGLARRGDHDIEQRRPEHAVRSARRADRRQERD